MKKISVIKKDSNKSRKLMPYEQELTSFYDMVNKFFDDSLFKIPSVFNQSFFNRNTLGVWWPKADISETNKEIKIKMNVPGVDPEKINIEADANTLVISGSTEKEEEEKGENWYRAERELGEFRRAFELPNGCDVENIKANSKHGSITIVIPKKKEAQKKKINVKVN